LGALPGESFNFGVKTKLEGPGFREKFYSTKGKLLGLLGPGLFHHFRVFGWRTTVNPGSKGVAWWEELLGGKRKVSEFPWLFPEAIFPREPSKGFGEKLSGNLNYPRIWTPLVPIFRLWWIGVPPPKKGFFQIIPKFLVREFHFKGGANKGYFPGIIPIKGSP